MTIKTAIWQAAAVGISDQMKIASKSEQMTKNRLELY